MYTVEFEVIGKDEFIKGTAQHVYNFKVHLHYMFAQQYILVIENSRRGYGKC